MKSHLLSQVALLTFKTFGVQIILLKNNFGCDIFENIIEKKTGCGFR